jgi:Uncharacterized protein, 4-oxalocrotonate tautomerase homolog
MPHIEIKCYPGRTEEVKRDCAKKVASDVAQMFGCDISAVSVSIKEIDKSEWKKVYDGQIMSDKKSLYVEPGYTCD